MGKLFELREKIEEEIKNKNLDPIETRGKIGLKAKFLVGSIDEKTPDNAVRIDNLKKAVKEILRIEI